MDGIYVYHYHNVSINKVFRILSTEKNHSFVFVFIIFQKFISGSLLPVPNKKKTYLHDISDMVK